MTTSFENRPLLSTGKVSLLILILSLLAVVILISLLATQFDLSVTLITWSKLGIEWILFCFILVFCSNLLRAGRLYHHFQSEMKGGFSHCLRISLYHNFINNLLPMRSGEASFPLLLKSIFSIDFTQSTAALLSFRLSDLLVLTLYGLFALLFGHQLSTHLLFLSIVLVLTLLVTLLLPMLLNTLSKLWPRMDNSLFKIREGLPRKPAAIFTLLLWTLLIWAVKLTSYALILSSFTEATMPLSLLGSLSGELASGIPLYTPAAFGSFEGGVLAVLIPSGIGQSTALTAAVNLHLFLLLASLVSAGFGLMLGPVKTTLTGSVVPDKSPLKARVLTNPRTINRDHTDLG
jgi:uncharacterized membrane protein YbhN (UPF0104 family)